MSGFTGDTAAEREAADRIAPVDVGLLDVLLCKVKFGYTIGILLGYFRILT